MARRIARRLESTSSDRPRRRRTEPPDASPGTARRTRQGIRRLAGALKRASLERQLDGEPLFTQQEIVEAALEPWRRGHDLLVKEIVALIREAAALDPTEWT